MTKYTLEFNLRTKRVERNIQGDYAVRYFNSEGNTKVKLGHTNATGLTLDASNWNRFVRIIRNGEIDQTGMKAVMCLTQPYLSGISSARLTDSIRADKIPSA